MTQTGITTNTEAALLSLAINSTASPYVTFLVAPRGGFYVGRPMSVLVNRTTCEAYKVAIYYISILKGDEM